MRRLMYLSLMLGLVVMASGAKAQSANTLGLGVILGSPTGFTGNYMLSEDRSIDAALAYDLDDDHDFHIHADYLFRNPESLYLEDFAMGWYWGPGVKFRSHDHDHHHHGHHHGHDHDYDFGPRVVAGLNHMFDKAPVEIFAESSIYMSVVPDTDSDLDIGIGARYYF